jgi:nickel/cobalt exporter
MKQLDKIGHFHLAVLTSSVIVLALVLGTHAAWAQFAAFGEPRPAAAGGITAWIFAEQAVLYRTLAGAIRRAKSDGSALWGLIGISFVYGIFHAAGPGRGTARR